MFHLIHIRGLLIVANFKLRLQRRAPPPEAEQRPLTPLLGRLFCDWGLLCHFLFCLHSGRNLLGSGLLLGFGVCRLLLLGRGLFVGLGLVLGSELLRGSGAPSWE